METMTLEQERKAFEKWARGKGLDVTRWNERKRGALPNEYMKLDTDMAWAGWQAAHLAQPAQAVDVVSVLDHLHSLAHRRKWSYADLDRFDQVRAAVTRALSGEKAGPVGEVKFDMVRIAEHLCPTDLPHLDKLRWKARKLTELLPASPTPEKEGK